MATVDQMVAAFIEVRRQIKQLEEEFEKDPRKVKLEALHNQLTDKLNAELDRTKATSIKTKYGTAIASVRYTASLVDPDIFMRYVISEGKFELIDRRANATAVKDFVKTQGVLPPGVNLNAIRTLGVRSPKEKPEVTFAVTTMAHQE